MLTFGGGVQEVQRELIAMFGLGLPRVPAMTDPDDRQRHERIMAEAERIKALGEASESAGAVPRQPGDDRHLAGRDGLRQRAVRAG